MKRKVKFASRLLLQNRYNLQYRCYEKSLEIQKYKVHYMNYSTKKKTHTLPHLSIKVLKDCIKKKHLKKI